MGAGRCVEFGCGGGGRVAVRDERVQVRGDGARVRGGGVVVSGGVCG